MTTNNTDIAAFAVEEALKAGADDADCVVVESRDTSLRTRLKEFENIEGSESRDLGIRVFLKGAKGYQTAIISTNNLLKNNLSQTVQRAIDAAKLAPADEHTKLAESGEYTKTIKDLQIYDDKEVSANKLKDWALEAESAALAVKGVTNSEGAEASYTTDETVMVTSKGFVGSYKSSGYSVSVSVIAGADNLMETDYEYCYTRFLEDLVNPSEIGRKAGELTVRKLNPRKIKTCKVPIIYDKKVSKSFLSSLCSGINGSSIVKKSSFLSDKMGQQIFPAGIDIIDDPKILRALSTEPFDAEGFEAEKMFLVKDGVLQNWILDLRTASKLGLKSNARASRGISSAPSPSSTNVYMNAGNVTPESLIKDVKEGLYLTDAFGMGMNGVTGDYSQGAAGFWIENGELTYPVSEITIAGNMLDMFKNITVANDLEMRYAKNAPTLRVDGMTIAGT